ncbi:hypothetical protein I7I50_00611 [Histoplasma capsulatum G186AR]|uniref:Uncharacterized protein n=1 Tax=Ajellomyces capsulatus TaxID=5037 RepID=A0A8H7YJN3_AJECA|nr:hypothetical protein I7I52_07879 [Histoplasma capsulatum]QSS72687.1 hypothetical protein I7I50_00611 [Histoplasma capsulatum G186AR]
MFVGHPNIQDCSRLVSRLFQPESLPSRLRWRSVLRSWVRVFSSPLLRADAQPAQVLLGLLFGFIFPTLG